MGKDDETFDDFYSNISSDNEDTDNSPFGTQDLEEGSPFGTDYFEKGKHPKKKKNN